MSLPPCNTCCGVARQNQQREVAVDPLTIDKLRYVAIKHLVDGLIDGLHGGIVCNGVSNANGHAVLQEPVVGQVLALTQEGTGSFRAMLHHNDMDERASRCSKSLLAQASSQQLPILNQNLHKQKSELSLPDTWHNLA